MAAKAMLEGYTADWDALTSNSNDRNSITPNPKVQNSLRVLSRSVSKGAAVLHGVSPAKVQSDIGSPRAKTDGPRDIALGSPLGGTYDRKLEKVQAEIEITMRETVGALQVELAAHTEKLQLVLDLLAERGPTPPS